MKHYTASLFHLSVTNRNNYSTHEMTCYVYRAINELSHP